MKKIKIVILFLATCIISNAVADSKIARLQYDGGGDWYNDPDAIPNLVKFLNRTISTDFASKEFRVKPSEQNLFNFPFIFLTGHGKIKFSIKDIKNLREYFQRGGFLYADDDYGMDSSFRDVIKRIFPDKQLVELPASHEIFHCYFKFQEGLPKIHKHDDKRPQAFAIFDDFGRMMVLYTYESNISDGWSDAHDDPQQIKQLAFEMGANIFYYLMTR